MHGYCMVPQELARPHWVLKWRVLIYAKQTDIHLLNIKHVANALRVV